MMPRGTIEAELVLPADPELARREAVYQCLQAAILTGRLAPGTVLSELALSEHLGVSRTPVHDALRELIADGLVVQETGRRAVVASVTGREAEEIFDMRLLLEGRACELAAGRIERGIISDLRAEAHALVGGRPTARWHERWTRHDSDFHHAIAAACGNRHLAADIGRYHRLHRGLNRYRADARSLQPAASEHLAIADALLARDARAAARAMRAHLVEWRAFFVARLDAGLV